MIYDFINGWHVKGEKGWDHHHSGSNTFPCDPNLYSECFNSIMMQGRDKRLVGQRPQTLKSILLSTKEQSSDWNNSKRT